MRLATRLNVLLFGGCLVHWPMTRTSKAKGRIRCNAYGPIRELHSFGEMFQIVEILRGQRKIPEEFQWITRMTELGPVPRAADFRDVDVVLLEPASPVELTFRGVAFNRNAITPKLKPIVDRGKEERKVAANWLRHGLVGLNEQIRAEAAAKLADYVVGERPEDDFARALFLEVRSNKADVLGGFTRMRELLNRPIGVVCYNFRYMPDGRPISWPAGFREEVLAAAQQLNLPVFDPAPMVQSFGVAEALAKDLGHYSEKFMPVAAEALVEFIESVYRNSGETRMAWRLRRGAASLLKAASSWGSRDGWLSKRPLRPGSPSDGQLPA
jgi:hypothetical protein